MKYEDMKKIILLLLMAVSGLYVTVFAHAQSAQPEGVWTLESASVVQSDGGVAVDVKTVKDDLGFGLFDELIFTGEQLTLVLGEFRIEGPVTVASNMIEINFTAAPLIFSWKTEQNRLYLEREYDALSSERITVSYKISSVYTKTKQ
jgi:hypothetical protein